MSRITEWSFRNRAAMIIAVVMALVAGVFSYFKLPMEFLPEADNPMVTITAIGPGYDAKSMEKLVTEPIEKAVSLVKGKTNTFSTSGNSFAKVDLYFDSKTDMKAAKEEVLEALSGVQLPERVSKPYVVQLNTSMIPISWVSIALDGGMTPANIKIAEEQIVPELQKIKGVGSVLLSGVATPQISVTVDPAKLGQTGIPFQAVMGILQGRDVSAAVGESVIGGAASNLRVSSSVNSVETLRKLPVGPGVTLGDIAQVSATSGQESVSRVGGKDVLVATISKGSNANAVSVGREVEETAKRLSSEIKGAEVTVLSSTSEQIVTSVNSLLREVLLGALFATIVILVFLRNIRTTLITIVSIPLSLAITLYLLDLSGVTLNVITLGGVAVAVGRLVDDSIVVIENIYRRLQKESFSRELVIDATKEVATAITSSTLTTVAVFLPMGLLRGSLQAFLLPFALTVTYSLLASLLVALTVVPLLSAVLLRGTKMKEHTGSARFSAFLRWNLKHKWVPLAISAVLFFGSIGVYVSMPKGAIDSSNASTLTVTMKYPEDVPQAEVLENGKKLEAFLLQQPEAKWVYMSMGNSSDAAQYGEVVSPTLVSYLIEVEKGENAENILNRVKEQRSQFPGAEIDAGAMDFMSGSGSTSVVVDLTGDRPELLEQTAAQVVEAIKPIEGVRKVETNLEQKKTVYDFEVNPLLANGHEIAMQLQGMLNPIPIGQISVDGEQTSVVLNASAKPASESDLSALTVMTAEGPKKVSEIAKLVKKQEPSLFYHKDGKPYVRITAAVEPSQLSIVGDKIKTKAEELAMPEGVTLNVGGASAEQAEDLQALGLTAIISIGIVYLIMVITFKTLRGPLAILFSLPLAAIGAVVALLVSGVSPDFTAMFGALMLIGIVVTNAIVLIDRVRQNEQHMPIREALVEAATTRMRPILMTAIATVCAMLPLIFGHTENGGSIVSQSLAIVVIGGLTAATLLTLIIVPCVYELFYFRKSARQRRYGLEQSA
ncbi:efflux RND transporter permease subunit [Paenibacillus thermoaerophilus]|uniref:Efflux RND transporter permease subunit n=1 Tax=Paenibacillus thermoaerophilus TaxID=1215385 RepID=A0ABW2V2I9_9BACL|nr:efflux RND transporter permease subunit [Paenibacillus thermoaerophilus]TMV11029.1 efflux RND transporter permease subunit [Paenibacillus thermoaerophilus]